MVVNKYPYDTDETGVKLTDKNFANLDSNSQLNLIDREEELTEHSMVPITTLMLWIILEML